MMQAIFPKVFTDKKFEYPHNHSLSLVCADGIEGWACCMFGNKPPEYFGIGMVKISKLIGVEATPDKLKKRQCGS